MILLLSLLLLPLQAQLPQYYNLGSETYCGDFSGSQGASLKATGNLPYADSNLVSGPDVRRYKAGNCSIPNAGANECMLCSEFYAGGATDLTLTFRHLAPKSRVSFTLYFAEIYQGIFQPGMRQFDILIDGDTVLQNFDVWAEANAQNNGNGGNNFAIALTFVREVGSSGQVDIVLKDIGINNPKINGIALLDANPLPVTWGGLEARDLGNRQIGLRWSTQQEISTEGFWVRYAQLGSATTEAVFVPAMGQDGEATSYETTLTALAPGDHVIRLASVDLDGTEQAGPQTMLSLRPASGLEVGQVFPNPVATLAKLPVSVSQAQTLRWQLRDLQGRLVRQSQEALPAAGAHPLTFDLTHLPDGLYHLQLIGPQGRVTRPLVVRH